MISIADQRDVPQYMDMPWLMTWVMALTISENTQPQTKTSGNFRKILLNQILRARDTVHKKTKGALGDMFLLFSFVISNSIGTCY